MSESAIPLLIGLALGALVSLLAWRVGVLARSGVWAAALTGGLTFGLGGPEWALLLLTFFLSSSAWSRAFARRKAGLAEKFAKGSRRDWAQVLANGGLGAILALVSTRFPGEIWPWVAYAGAIATVNADTWATELGVFSRTPPRLITNGRPVEQGASGGVTWLGYLAALGGAGLIGGLAGWVGEANSHQTLLWGVVIVAGLAGATFDSVLGASVQAIYYCPQCGKETERSPVHSCGRQTEFLRGWRWMDNDWVNFLSSIVGAMLSIGLWRLFSVGL